ncbi:MAG: Ig-like domain-containing protein [Clostridium sp.]|nr:Ig-like domain-containing protein [Clostridium sp.]
MSFNSQNSEIATVDNNGVITGISKGSTTVEVTVGNKTKIVNVEVRKSSFLFILIGLL